MSHTAGLQESTDGKWIYMRSKHDPEREENGMDIGMNQLNFAEHLVGVRDNPFFQPIVNDIPVQERDFLRELYESTQGDGWLSSKGWNDPTVHPSEWDGLIVVEGHVRAIDLGGNGLCGTIPESIGNMVGLENLDMSWNLLQGHVPETIGNLASLVELKLYHNRLSGQFPQNIGQCANLETLLIWRNEFTLALPSTLRQCTLLSRLWAFDNNFSIIGREVLDMPSLNTPMSESVLTRADVEKGRAFKLLPSARSLPCEEMAFIRELFHDTHGAHWARNDNWEDLESKPNEWYGLNIDTRLNCLVGIRMLCNKLIGRLPTSVGGCVHLREIVLDSNGFNCPLPSTLGECTALETLSLPNNRMEGIIPSGIGSCINLQLLDLRSNGLSGCIPKSMCELEQLHTLQLGFNRLSGAIPFLGSCTRLRKLQLANNKLTGVLPEYIGKHLVELRYLNAYQNQLSGPLPDSLFELAHLEELRLQQNQFTGSIPGSVGSCTALTLLDVSMNGITGALPSSIGQLGKLEELYLNHNAMSDKLPETLGNCTFLQRLEVNNNRFRELVETKAILRRRMNNDLWMVTADQNPTAATVH